MEVWKNFVGALKNEWFYASERTRLRKARAAMLEHQKKCLSCTRLKNDFLSRAHDEEYNKLLEHYGAQFWTKYFEGEHPVCILDHSLIEHIQHKLYKDQNANECLEVLPDTSSSAR